MSDIKVNPEAMMMEMVRYNSIGSSKGRTTPAIERQQGNLETSPEETGLWNATTSGSYSSWKH
jgi:hypothetical protein